MTAYYKNKGPACFDFKYYMEHSTDLRSLENDKRATWEHFINLGLFEDRNFRCVLECGGHDTLVASCSTGLRVRLITCLPGSTCQTRGCLCSWGEPVVLTDDAVWFCLFRCLQRAAQLIIVVFAEQYNASIP